MVIGIVLAGVILWLTGYFTGTDAQPGPGRRRTSLTGAATVVLSGISVGFESAVYTALRHRRRRLRRRSCSVAAR